MSKIFKPRRGSATTMNGSKASTVLAEGELFFEYPDTGVGTGECKIKLGDGSTAYSSLPYAVDGTAISSKAVTVTSNSSTTITAALNNVATGKTLGVIVGALKQAVSLCNTSITELNDEIAEGTGLTDTQAAQLTALYNQLVYNKNLGDIITVSLSGSHTNSSYQMQICYLNSSKICLLGYTNLGSGTWSTCCGYSWTVTIAAGVLTTNARTVTSVKIPTQIEIYSTTANYVRSFTYWTSTPNSSNAWRVASSGSVYTDSTSNSYGALPYAVIDL